MAALLVAMRHTTPFFGSVAFQESYLAVDTFFVLSGVVIANSYEARLTSTMPVGRFTWIRLARIYPLYLLGSSIAVLLIISGNSAGVSTPGLVPLIILATFMLPNVVNLADGTPYPLDHPAWSLFYEMIANVFYAQFIRLLTNSRLFGIIVLSALGLAGCLYISQGHSMDLGWTRKNLPAGLFRVGYSFFAGVLLYRLFAARPAVSLYRWKALFALFATLAVVATTLMLSPGPSIRPYYDFVAVIALFPAVIYLALRIQLQGFAAKVCQFMGVISYAVYALHEPVGELTRRVLSHVFDFSVEDYAPLIGLGFLVSLMAFCWVVDAVYDIPVRRVLLGRKPLATPERVPSDALR